MRRQWSEPDRNGGGGGGALATVVVTPATATLFTVEPGNTVTLAVMPKDQNGQTVTGAGAPSFSSDNGSIASVQYRWNGHGGGRRHGEDHGLG